MKLITTLPAHPHSNNLIIVLSVVNITCFHIAAVVFCIWILIVIRSIYVVVMVYFLFLNHQSIRFHAPHQDAIWARCVITSSGNKYIRVYRCPVDELNQMLNKQVLLNAVVCFMSSLIVMPGSVTLQMLNKV